ncbi:response regulator [Aurantimonas sp. VKM B-3413]|uniref:response regulator n=1 Tax=Aurantimonas sp. VKM B-3413 TaxID=2779401 RepID=UPI001E354516|nr:response regulator [Aurantimonas sp. VKM B-3413]MCB8840221.1 response regulator [Aurantimonas sp. VKM B-3413]
MSDARPVVAIVDDDPTVLGALEELLESSGYEAFCFLSARDLLASGLSRLDVLITDIGMPGMDGFALRDLVKEERPELPVFLITGRHELAEQGRARGIQGLFRKPFDAQNLLTAIGEAMDRTDKGE